MQLPVSAVSRSIVPTLIPELIVSVGSLIRCVIERAGRIGSKAKVSLPEVPLQLPSLSSKDKDDLMFAIREGVDFIVVPNVTNADTLRSVREMLSGWKLCLIVKGKVGFVVSFAGNGGKEIQLIAKIETVQGVYNVDEIIDRADAVLIARAALSVSLSLEKVFLAQKSIIAKCNKVSNECVFQMHLFGFQNGGCGMA